MDKMFNFNGMPYKRSGRAGGKSVSMIGMLVLLLATLLVFSSCTGDDETVVMGPECGEGTELNAAGDACVPTLTCGEGTVPNAAGDMCVSDPAEEYDMIGELEEGDCYMDGDRDGMIAGTDADECIMGEGGNDSIKGMGGKDDITGGPGNDTLYGGEGDDELTGGVGDDTLNGGPGDDELTGGSGDNALDGGEGEDIAIYLGAMRAIINLNMGTARVQHATPATVDPLVSQETDDGIGDDTLANIENVKGTHGNDTINGNGDANVLEGLDGADTINGHDGDDTIIPNRPANVNAMGDPIANVATVTDVANANAEGGIDGLDVVDGGDGSGDTISYEGEGTAVVVNLGAIIPAIEDDDTTSDTDETRISHVAANVGGQTDGTDTVQGNTDRITVVDIGTEDDPNVVSTIENVTGGTVDDTLTGDNRDNTLTGGGGDDTLNGAGGADTLNGGPGADSLTGGDGDDTLNGGPGADSTLAGNDGDDTYLAVDGAETVTEAEDEGTDTVYYTAPVDDPSTANVDESMNGIGSGGAVSTPANVEKVFGTQNDDTLVAAAGAAVLGLEGDDTLTGDTDTAATETLVGCAGENTLTGADGDDVFGVFNDGDKADTIVNFTTGATDTGVTDEIHLKGFDMDATARAQLIPGNSAQAGVYVDGVLVAIVGSTTILATPDDGDLATVENTALQNILVALKKDGAVVFDRTFDPADCSSN